MIMKIYSIVMNNYAMFKETISLQFDLIWIYQIQYLMMKSGWFLCLCILILHCLFQGMICSYTPININPSGNFNITSMATLNMSSINMTMDYQQYPQAINALHYNSSANKTTFYTSFFNQSNTNFQSSLQSQALPGQWIFGINSNFACNLITQVNSASSLFIYVNTNITILNYSSPPPSLTSGVNLISTNCKNFFNFDGSNSNVYTINQNTFNTYSQASFVTVSNDFTYLFSNLTKTIKMLNSATGQYSTVYTQNQSKIYNKIELVNSSNNVIMISQSYIYTDNIISAIDWTFDIFTLINGGLVKIKSITATVNTITDILYSFSSDLSIFISFLRNTNGSITLIGQKIDFPNSKAFLIAFSDSNHLQQMMQSIQGFTLAVSSFYFTLTNANVQETYNIIGLNARFFNAMAIPSKYQGSYGQYYIGSATLPNLRVFLIGPLVNQTFMGTYFDYGTASNSIPPAPNAAFLTLQPPSAITQQYAASNLLFWAYTYINAPSQTIPTGFTSLQILDYNPLFPNNYLNLTMNVDYGWSPLFMRPMCGIFKMTVPSQDQYRLLVVDTQNLQNTVPIDISSLVLGAGVTASSTWYVSENCTGFRFDQKIFKVDPANPTSYVSISNADFTWTAIDEDLTYAITNKNSQLWTYNQATNAFVSSYTLNTPVSNPTLSSYMNNALVVDTLGNSIRAIAFNNNGSKVSLVVDSSITGFGSAPKSFVSPNITKLLVIGSDPKNAPMNTILSFNYSASAGSAATNMTLDNYLSGITISSYIYLEDNFLLVRDIAANFINPQEYLYLLQANGNINQIVVNPISASQQSTWNKTILQYGNTPNDIIIFDVYKQDGNIVIMKTEANSKLASANSQNSAVAYTVINGQLMCCPIGCNGCSSGVCSGCIAGYAFNSNTCTRCGQNCASCASTSVNTCISCLNGSYLSSNSSCLKCDSSCVNCIGSATNCTQCMLGKFLFSQACAACSSNCFVCTNSNSCTTCALGYVALNNACLSCSVLCTSCLATNITYCTKCAQGLQLLNGQCIACPSNCNICNGNNCTQCTSGYTPNSDNVCVMSCSANCASCAKNQPTQCTSCYYGSSLSGSTCLPSLSCNTNNSCTNCGVGLNYYLSSYSQCVVCPSISNCLQCNGPSSPSSCILCANGYYIDANNSCSLCPSICTTCSSYSICSGCQPGYTLSGGQTTGNCLACTTPCLTCLNSQSYCLSCVTGFTRVGWFCKDNNNVGFQIILQETSSNILGSINSVQSDIKNKVCGSNSDLCSKISVYFNKIDPGSTVIDGSIVSSDSNAQTLNTASSNFNTQIAKGSSLAGFSVGSSSSVVNSGSSSSSQSSSSNSAMIIGLAVGIPVGVILIALVVFYLRSRKDDDENDEIKGTEHQLKEKPYQIGSESIKSNKNKQGQFDIE